MLGPPSCEGNQTAGGGTINSNLTHQWNCQGNALRFISLSLIRKKVVSNTVTNLTCLFSVTNGSHSALSYASDKMQLKCCVWFNMLTSRADSRMLSNKQREISSDLIRVREARHLDCEASVLRGSKWYEVAAWDERLMSTQLVWLVQNSFTFLFPFYCLDRTQYCKEISCNCMLHTLKKNPSDS